jgi:hypothetical protein
VTDDDTANDTVERALRLFVYGPVGLACYLRDSAPTFMDVFVSRGKREIDGARRAVEERLGLAKSAPAPPTAQQRVADGLGNLGKVAAQAAAMAGPVVSAATNAAANAASSMSAPRPGGIPSVGNPETAVRGAAAAGAGNGSTTDLPIPGYDGLSATQVIERLDGLSRGALERVRLYELAHRARRTILASIDQLTA